MKFVVRLGIMIVVATTAHEIALASALRPLLVRDSCCWLDCQYGVRNEALE
jgi:hypothetical protein